MTTTLAVKPKIICLCGEAGQMNYFSVVTRERSKGNIVLFPEHLETNLLTLSAEQMQSLNFLHINKVRAADEIIVVNPNNIFSDATKKELVIAHLLKTPINFEYPPSQEIINFLEQKVQEEKSLPF